MALYKTIFLRLLSSHWVLAIFLGVTCCSFRLRAAEDNLRVELDTGWASRIYEDSNGNLWIGTANGLYRKDVDAALPVAIEVITGQVSSIYEDRKGNLWIGTKNGLFRKDAKEALPVVADAKIEWVDTIHEDRKGNLWIGAETGLFRKDAVARRPVLIEANTGWVQSIHEDRKGILWIGAKKGLFRKDANADLPVATEVNTGFVTLIFEDKRGNLWVRAEKDLFRKDAEAATPVATNVDVFKIVTIHVDKKDNLWLGGDSGLVRKDAEAALPVAIDVNTGRVGHIYEDRKGNLWIGTEKGLFRKDVEEALPVTITANTGFVSCIFEDKKSNIWIGAKKGLFQVASPNGEWGAKIQVSSNLPDLIVKDTALDIAWTIGNYQHRSTPDLIKCRVLINQENGSTVERRRYDIPQKQFEFSFRPQKHTPLQPGKYSLQIEAEDLHGKLARSPKLAFSVKDSYKEEVVDWLKAIGGWTAVIYCTINFFVFTVLVVGSRWSRRCFEILTDPIVQKLGIYFGFALLHCRFLRLWVFERYFQLVKKDLSTDHEYVDRPLFRADGTELPTSQLLNELRTHPHIWLSGKPGVGKSEMMKMLAHSYFAEPSLRAAWKRYHFVPISVPLRRVPGKTVSDLAMECLRQSEMPFDDEKYFKRFFSSADFLVLLDGFNEAALEEVALFTAPSSVRLLVTSQTKPQQTHGKFALLEISPVTSDIVKRLLIAFLGKEKGEGAADKVAKSLRDEIESAYDVQLIADLFDAGHKLPSNPLKLYESVFDNAVAPDSYPKQIVCEFAWECWKKGKRRFKADEKLTTDLLKPLQEASIVVLRGTDFEFRHDLMRGYLAALWAVNHAASMQVTLERLQEKDIWNLSPSDQESVFQFLTRLVETKADLTLVAQFAAKEPRVRVVLLDCAQKAASKKKWGKLDINFGTDEEPNEQDQTGGAGI